MNVIETGLPCPFCNVRPDIACPHRPADPNWRGMVDRRPSRPLDKAHSCLNGIREIRNARTGKMVRIRGRGG